jgi:hypothetical protein
MDNQDLSKAIFGALSSAIGNPLDQALKTTSAVHVEISGLTMTLSMNNVIVKYAPEG